MFNEHPIEIWLIDDDDGHALLVERASAMRVCTTCSRVRATAPKAGSGFKLPPLVGVLGPA